MDIALDSPNGPIDLEPLTPSNFADFGSVVENPGPSPTSSPAKLPQNATLANQGSAIKYTNVSRAENLYHLAPSRKPGTSAMTLFSCQPRQLRSLEDDTVKDFPAAAELVSQIATPDEPSLKGFVLEVSVLERHPYTTQTFIPLGLEASSRTAMFVVVVAPKDPVNLICSAESNSEFSARSKNRLHCAMESDGVGLPSLKGVRAFLARGNQAVTYAAGTWHAPMIVLGKKQIDFVVTQHSNGVSDEDCQEINIKGEPRMSGIQVCIDSAIQHAKEYGQAQVGSVPLPGATMDEIWHASHNDMSTSTIGQKTGGLPGRL